MASPRRVGAETSKTRDVLLDCVERLMLETGYASVTYRAVAAKAAVTPGLVQYYFPTLDDLFVAAIRRRSEQNLERLAEALRTHADQPLRVLWEYSRDESTSALTTEFLALGNHRKSIGSEITEFTEQARRLQLDALEAALGDEDIAIGALPPSVLLFVLTGVPKLIRLEGGVGISSAHAEVVQRSSSISTRWSRRGWRRNAPPRRDVRGDDPGRSQPMTAGMESQPRTVVVGRAARPVEVDLPLGKPVQHLVEGDSTLEPSQGCTEAVVRAVPEGHVLTDVRGGCRTDQGSRSDVRRGWPTASMSSNALPAGTV